MPKVLFGQMAKRFILNMGTETESKPPSCTYVTVLLVLAANAAPSLQGELEVSVHCPGHDILVDNVVVVLESTEVPWTTDTTQTDSGFGWPGMCTAFSCAKECTRDFTIGSRSGSRYEPGQF
jgi:hypothetical protein